ncbi:MAG: YajG family lipoprotein [Gammaproteobacteria bacterium]
MNSIQSRFKLGLLGMAVMFFSGCAFTPQQAEITPQLELVQSDEGRGTTVYLRVIDERSNQIIGRRGTGAMKGAEITTTEELDVVFHNAIADGLRQKGFEVVTDSGRSHTLKVEIRSFEYDVSMGFWTGGVHTNAALKAIAKRGGQEYENVYRFDGEQRVMFVPGKDKNQQMINAMADGILAEMFRDNALIGFLAQ